MGKYKVFIDPGHGGNDPGAVGNGMRESDIVLDVSLRLETILQAAGIDTMMSRRTDVRPSQRAQMANNWGADLLCSVHVNAAGGTGVETVIPTASPNNSGRDLQANRRCAEIVSNAIAGAFNMRVRRANGVMLETETPRGSIGVLRDSKMIAILPELAFIDSPPHNPDVEILRHKRQELAQALASGILVFIGIAAPAPPQRFPLSEKNIMRMVEQGAIQSPEFWRNVDSIQWLDKLLYNAGCHGVLDRRVENGISDLNTAIKVLAEAKIISSPEYWLNLVNNGGVEFLGQLLINIANKCLDPLHRTVFAEANTEDIKGQVLVVNVIMNRHRDRGFQVGFYNVIFAPNQFEPTRNGAYARAIPTGNNKLAVQMALDGLDYSRGALFFDSAENSWARQNREHLFDHGNHSFFA